MDTRDIVSEIDAEIARLQQARDLLLGIDTTPRKRGRPAKATAPKATSFNPEGFTKKAPKRRTLSAAARERIAAAQRTRWAKSKAAAKEAASAA
jgi:hypothetical protein